MHIRKTYKEEEGYILVTCLVIMVVLTLVGIMATNTSYMEVTSSVNDRVAKSAFYRADSGVYTAPKVIRESLDEAAALNLPNFQLINPVDGTTESSSDFYDKMKGYIDAGPGVDPSSTISFQQNTQTTTVNILQSGSEPLEGESVEFLSGYGGTGQAMAFTVLYRLDSTGTAEGNGVSNIESMYKYIPRPGGL